MNEIIKSQIDEIIELHNEMAGLMNVALKKAMRVGELLTRQKEALKHGDFMPWIKANLPFTDRTARRYMQVYEGRELIAKTDSVSDLKAACRLLTEPKDPYCDARRLTCERLMEFEHELAAATTTEECTRVVDEALQWQNMWAEFRIKRERLIAQLVA